MALVNRLTTVKQTTELNCVYKYKKAILNFTSAILKEIIVQNGILNLLFCFLDIQNVTNYYFLKEYLSSKGCNVFCTMIYARTRLRKKESTD